MRLHQSCHSQQRPSMAYSPVSKSSTTIGPNTTAVRSQSAGLISSDHAFQIDDPSVPDYDTITDASTDHMLAEGQGEHQLMKVLAWEKGMERGMGMRCLMRPGLSFVNLARSAGAMMLVSEPCCTITPCNDAPARGALSARRPTTCASCIPHAFCLGAPADLQLRRLLAPLTAMQVQGWSAQEPYSGMI